MVLFEGRTAPKTNDWKLKNDGFQRKNPIFQASRGWFKRYVMLRGKKHLIIFDEVVMYAAVLWPRGMWDIRFYSSCHVGRSVTWKAKTAEHGLFQSWKYTFAHNNMFGILGHPPANIGIRHYQSSTCHQQSIYICWISQFLSWALQNVYASAYPLLTRGLVAGKGGIVMENFTKALVKADYGYFGESMNEMVRCFFAVGCVKIFW